MNVMPQMTIKPIITTADDYCQLRQGPLRMYFPVDPDTTERLQRVVSGSRKLSQWERLMRWMRRR